MPRALCRCWPPMSAIAGNMAITIGSYYLARFNNGKGIQLGTVLGTRYGKVVIIGDGVVGRHAAKTADGMGAQVVLFGRQRDRAAQLTQDISPHLRVFESTPDTIADQLEDADLVIGAVLVRGAKAPYVVTEAMVQRMQPGSVIVDVSIDQGGCIATSRPTSHSEPVFEKHGGIHYCVTNMPGAYPQASTLALTTATLPYVLQLAQQGLDALRANPGFGKGVNTYKGSVTSKPVAKALSLLSQFKEF
jgi:alanine dehydrogenase